MEDHLMVAEMFAMLIEREPDMQLAGTAHGVAEALALVRSEHPHVVLMDYRLPDGDGITAVREILEGQPETHILMLSGDAPEDLMAQAIEAGCVGMLAKNRPMDELLSAIRSASRGELVFRVEEMNTLLEHLRKPTNPDAEFLTRREIEVLQLLAEGYSTDRIANTLFISIHTVRNHVSKILSKLGAHSKLEAVAIATRDKIVTLGA
ncbi:MAG: response regulator transcription factor [Acidimicrobiales bacterium]